MERWRVHLVQQSIKLLNIHLYCFVAWLLVGFLSIDDSQKSEQYPREDTRTGPHHGSRVKCKMDVQRKITITSGQEAVVGKRELGAKSV